jgi:hypothetical protein
MALLSYDGQSVGVHPGVSSRHTHLYGQRVECGDSRWVLEMSHVGLED